MEQKEKKRKISPLLWFIIIVFVAVGAYLAYHEIVAYLPNSEQIPFKQYSSPANPDDIYIVLEDKLIQPEYLPTEKDGRIFLPADFIKQNIDKYIFWDEQADRLTVTTDYSVTHYAAGDELFFKDGMAYVSANLITELYNVEISFKRLNNIVVVDFKEHSRNISKVTVKTCDLRYEPDKKSPIEEKLVSGTELVTYSVQNEYTYVRTPDGLLGYVLTKDITFERTIEKITKTEPKPYKLKPVTETGKINVIFEQVFSTKQSADESTRIVRDGLDVLCPTWFSFDESLSGDIVDIGDKSYVDWAHKNGMSVWGLLSDNFDEDVAHFILGDTLKREYVIKQILELISTYELDGINIDFENVRRVDSEYYIQFIRELAPPLKQRGIVLSVDMFVPKDFNLYYNRTEVGSSADFIIIMGYDEYWKTSPESGPVASIGFVESGIYETLKEVPKEKIILGIPFYNRVWTETETADGVKVSAEDYGMEYPYKLFTERGAKFEWNEETQNYYAQYTGIEKGVRFTKKLWLEDERSVEQKLKLFEKYDIAGVAGWKKGLEKEIIWDLLFEYTKKH